MQITADQLYKIRKVHRLTQAQVGEMAGVSDAFINQIERNKYHITPKVSEGITRALDITPDRLLEILAVFDDYDVKAKMLPE